MNLKRMNPLEHGIRVAREASHKDGWDGWKFPDSPTLPQKPWHPDGDEFFRTKPTKKVENSDAIMAHLKSTGDLVFRSGRTRPNHRGNTHGIFLNKAGPGDPEFTISRENGPRNLCVTTGYRAPYGTKIRIPKNAIVQGYPMNEYSDHKLHIFDTDRNTITEIQFVIDVSVNPILSAILNLAKFFGIGRGAGGLQCHGVKVYSLNVPSTHPTVIGSTAANIPNAATKLRYDDLVRGYTHMTSMGVKAGRKGKFVYPAQATDGPSEHPDAICNGQVLRLTEEGFQELLRVAGDNQILQTIVYSWFDYGIMVVDTGGTNSTGVEPDNRLPHDDLEEFGKHVTFDLFEVWEW